MGGASPADPLLERGVVFEAAGGVGLALAEKLYVEGLGFSRECDRDAEKYRSCGPLGSAHRILAQLAHRLILPSETNS